MRKARSEVGPAHRDQRVHLEDDLRADHGDLERGLVRRVADERVGERERHRVHRPARAQAHALVAMPPAVLHRREQPRPQHPDAHAPFRQLMNSSRPMARKRTRSPGQSRLGRARFASNSTMGVRPITFQPPEIAYG